MVVYELMPDRPSSPAETRRVLRQLAANGIGSVQIDARGAAASDGVALAEIVGAARMETEVTRLHCLARQWSGPLRETAATLVDVHVPSGALGEWEEDAGEAASTCALTVALEPGRRPAPLRRRPVELRIGFVAQWEAGARWSDYAPAASAAVEWIETMSRASVPVSIDGALPFCLFTDAQQGMLARECLAADDYRQPRTTLAFRADDTVSPWSGPLRHLFRSSTGVPIGSLLNFYRARERMSSEGIEECRGCPLRGRACAAWQFHARPDPWTRRCGVLDVPDLVRSLGYARITPHPHVRVRANGDGAELSIDGDRTLSAVRLNAAALAVWRCVTASDRVETVVRTVCADSGEGMALPTLQVLAVLQESGFVACRVAAEEGT